MILNKTEHDQSTQVFASFRYIICELIASIYDP